MSHGANDGTPLSPLKQAFLALQDAQSRIASLEARRAEPVAIVGVACRVPSAADGPDGYWTLLRDRTDAVSRTTLHRWRECGSDTRFEKLDDAIQWSALLDRPDHFDPKFFGISPREAGHMDPQQRLLLELSWEALEDAAIAPGSTYGDRIGVYFGISSNDFAQIALTDCDERNIDAHLASGGAHSVAAGRVSYTFGWHGPALSIDTACSSSLVAVHLACEAIRSRDCDTALAGGVNLILSPASSIAFARSGMLSSSGRVDAFGLGADGFVRGEGCGVVVLKRLSAAWRDGDRVLAVIAGSAVNHDGPGSGLTVPNGQAQAALLRSALASAGIAPAQVGYVEAHGTGTRLGDPIEAEALGAVFGSGKRERPLAIGSVKTNIGHLESAAGIAGLIKVVLALEHGELPAQLYGDPPSEHVRWKDLPLEVVRERRRWEPIGGRRIAGVSGFGFSGTNAHVIVEEAPAQAPRKPVPGGEVLVLSAKSAASLAMLAERYAGHLEMHPEQDWGDVCYTAAAGRTHFRHRMAVVASSSAEAVGLLRGGRKGVVSRGSVLVGGSGAGPPARDLAEAYASGAEMDWSAQYASVAGGYDYRRVRLPGYAFERERHWLSGSRRRRSGSHGDATGLPLLGERLRLAGEGARYEWQARPAGELAWLGEHRIAGKTILPATAYVEMLFAAGDRLPGTGEARVEELSLTAPLPLVEDGSAWPLVQVVVEAADAGQRSRVRVYSSGQGNSGQAGSEWRLHGEGHVSRVEVPRAEVKAALRNDMLAAFHAGAVHERCAERIEAADFYARMEARGAEFGPRFKGVRRIWRGEREALGEILLEAPAASFGYRLHPAGLDACLQVAAALLPDFTMARGAAQWLPARMEKLQYDLTAMPLRETTCLVHARLLGSTAASAAEVGYELYLQNQNRPFATIGKIQFKKINDSRTTDSSIEKWFYKLSWNVSPLTSHNGTASRNWIVASSSSRDSQRMAQSLVNELLSHNQHATLLDVCAITAQHALPGGERAIGIVYVHEPLIARSGSTENITVEARPVVEELLDLCRTLVYAKPASPRLYVLTFGARSIEPHASAIHPLEGVVSGLAATIAAEHEALNCVRIDVDATDVVGSLSQVAREVLHDGPDDWVALREGKRLLPRLERVRRETFGEGDAMHLAWTPGEGIESLRFEPIRYFVIGSNEIEITVRAAGLNFHDVLSVLGILNDTAPLGSECSGVVSRVGPGVTRCKPGDEVVALAAAALGQSVITSEDLVYKKPATLSFEQAASLPVAYLTAAYSLLQKGGLSAGKRILIHAASGGVGLAAVYLCQRYGAEIFATAGSEEKREYLRRLGIEHVMDSRSDVFAKEIKRLTNGRGVDIVLNCLAGHLTDAGLAVTSRSGNFIEIGATDIRDAIEIATKHPGVAYSSVDLVTVVREERETIKHLLQTIIEDVGTGVLPPLPVEYFAWDDAVTAFRHMAAARHIGKIVFTSRESNIERPKTIASDASYIVTGGMTGLGLEVTLWLGACGVRRIVVAGRRGPSPRTVNRFEQVRKQGTDVVIVEGDLADPAVATRIVENAGDLLHGIVHCAGAVDDAPLAAQSWETFSKTLRAKADGAWLLHEKTRSKPLDFFVMFSSWASIAGSPDAANYCAANMFLDALADHRRSAGLVAASINWGPWARVGMAARQPEEHFASRGLRPMLLEMAIRALELAIANAAMPHVAIADVDWVRLASFIKRGHNVATVYRRTQDYAAASAESSQHDRPILKISANGSRANSEVLSEHPRNLSAQIRMLLFKVLELPPETEIDPNQPLQQLGLDSILAVELASSVSSLAGRPMPSGLVFDYPTLASLTAHITESMTALVAAAPVKRAERVKSREDSVLDRLEDLTDDEVERLLREKTLAG